VKATSFGGRAGISDEIRLSPPLSGDLANREKTPWN
jgi:hypothetical protein